MSSTAESGIDPVWLWRMSLNSSISTVNIPLKVHLIERTLLLDIEQYSQSILLFESQA